MNMVSEKKEHVRAEAIPFSAYVQHNKIEDEREEVLLDVDAGKLEGGAYGNLKLAKDGHVSLLTTIPDVGSESSIRPCWFHNRRTIPTILSTGHGRRNI